VYIVGKVLNENIITTQMYLPRLEFRNLIDKLSGLIKKGLLQSYNYVIQDLRAGRWSRETIPYEFFKNGSWIYDHEKIIKELRDSVKLERDKEQFR
jgi:hypothetical protein